MYDSEKIFNDVVLGQYKTSPKFSAILQQIIDAHNISPDIAAIHSTCFDLDTAIGVWLDLLGKKIGLNRILKVRVTDGYFFGFDGNSFALGFDQAPFYSDLFIDFIMNDDQYRAALKIKAEANYLSANVQNINALLRKYFNTPGCFVKFFDVLEMAFCFSGTISNWQKALLPLIFPIPAAVSLYFFDNYTNQHLGFEGNSNAFGFDQKPFFDLEAYRL